MFRSVKLHAGKSKLAIDRHELWQQHGFDLLVNLGEMIAVHENAALGRVAVNVDVHEQAGLSGANHGLTDSAGHCGSAGQAVDSLSERLGRSRRCSRRSGRRCCGGANGTRSTSAG